MTDSSMKCAWVSNKSKALQMYVHNTFTAALRCLVALKTYILTTRHDGCLQSYINRLKYALFSLF